MKKLRIGTRGSPLALWQADHVADLVRAAHPGMDVERVIIHTKGDRVLDQALAKIGDKGLFTKELERALLLGEIDVAVHSMKDVPSEEVPGLVLAATPKRGSVEDVLVAPVARSLDDLAEGAVVATGSLRRRAQLMHARPDLQIVDVRGNLQTRLRKLDENGWDGMILAAAGLERMGLTDRIAFRMDPMVMLPAVGQGALYVQAAADSPVLEIMKSIDDPATAVAIRAERRFMRILEGGCQVPIGALGRLEGERLLVDGFVASRDGRQLVRRSAEGLAAEAEAVGEQVAQAVIDAGGREILKEARCEGEGN